MTYRCPYCKSLIAGEPPPKCPSCGKTMVVPKMREPHPRIARYRTIEKIWRETEQKKADLQGVIPPSSIKKSPRFYMAVVVVLVVIGLFVVGRSEKTAERKRTPELRTLANLDVLAEALGRYRFHAGEYPTAGQGLAALVRDPGIEIVPDWNGPYISHLPKDFWDTPYVYAPPATPDGLPTLFSCGPDRLPDTPDDLKPDPLRFDPGTEWTNGWLRAEDRLPGVKIYKP